VLSHQSHPTTHPQLQRDNNSPPTGLTPNSAQSYPSPLNGNHREQGNSPPPNSTSSPVNGRGLTIHDMVGGSSSQNGQLPHGSLPERRAKNDDAMISKLDRKA
jgi:hypothetical protein